MIDVRFVTIVLVYSCWFLIGSCWLSDANNSAKSAQYVTCGSVLKLVNDKHQVRLHSQDISYGSGSGQQTVTAKQDQDDVNSHWVVKGETKKLCTRGEPVKCDSVLRLTHLATNKNLHSHHFKSPLSRKQEVSAYGKDGLGDTGDHWAVECDGDFWERSEKVMLKHVDTGVYLGVTPHIYQRPIFGQLEVVGLDFPGNSVHWRAAEGVFIHPSEESLKKRRKHSEL